MNKKTQMVFSHEIQSIIFNLIPASSTLSAGLGLGLTWYVTSSSCRSPHQGIIAQPTVQDPKMQARQNASGNGNMLSNMMRLQDDIRKSRSKPWLVAPSLEGPLVGIRLGKTTNALQEPIVSARFPQDIPATFLIFLAQVEVPQALKFTICTEASIEVKQREMRE